MLKGMEVKLSMVIAVILAALCLGASALTLPREDLKQNALQLDSQSAADLDKDERATYLDTRELEDDFKQMVFLAINELANEGRINGKNILNGSKSKRGRWQGFCFRRTATGRFLPYICWKGSRK